MTRVHPSKLVPIHFHSISRPVIGAMTGILPRPHTLKSARPDSTLTSPSKTRPAPSKPSAPHVPPANTHRAESFVHGLFRRAQKAALSRKHKQEEQVRDARLKKEKSIEHMRATERLDTLKESQYGAAAAKTRLETAQARHKGAEFRAQAAQRGARKRS